jgi:hypothetical protein
MSKFTKALEKAQQEREIRKSSAAAHAEDAAPEMRAGAHFNDERVNKGIGQSQAGEWKNRAAKVRDMIGKVENELFYA